MGRLQDEICNPFMSLWLNSTNKVLSSARGHTTPAVESERASTQAQATKKMVYFQSAEADKASPSSLFDALVRIA